ncbi:ATPase domain-containing protein [Massilia sp. 9I]|uniref:ATPase domain-containing protein n=1 Tax=Massilia sp. 9I TaxID=2653152 RepID=UPI0012F405F5|nr:ATPase domain-containing protein [Massilia sp. 9I]VXC58883.1 Circadian clock protein KaiC [Massilia sp. 9I]
MTDKLDLNTLATGVPGLDTILGGGLPELSFNIIGGAPGSGKTTFAQQIMFGLAGPGRKALFFTAMGEPPVKMLRYQQQFGFFDVAKVGDSVEFITLAPQVEEGNYDAVMAQIQEEVRVHNPALVFIDSFRSFIEGARGDQREIAALQAFVQQLAAHMSTWKATSFLIGEYSTSDADRNPIFTVADGIFWLSQQLERSAMSRKIQIVKIRGQKQRPGLHAFRIERGGISVFPRMMPVVEASGVTPATQLPRLSSGVPVLDQMLGGGIPVGYSVLLTGPTGSGKTILATEFLAAGAARGEHGIAALFERGPHQMMNLKLDAMVRAGQVSVMPVRELDLSIDELLHELLARIDATGATRIVLDSLTGFELAIALEYRDDFRDALYRLTTVLRARGVTVVMTSEMQDRFDSLHLGSNGSGVLVDAVVLQRFVEANSALHTIISVVKVRGSRHSREFRLFEVTDDGVLISEEPVPFDGVLRGTASLRVSAA